MKCARPDGPMAANVEIVEIDVPIVKVRLPGACGFLPQQHNGPLKMASTQSCRESIRRSERKWFRCSEGPCAEVIHGQPSLRAG